MADPLLVVDSDLVIDFLRGSDPGRAHVRDWLRSGSLRLTAVTAFELRVGADYGARAEGIGRILRRRTLPLDLRAAMLAGEVYRALRERGLQIDLRDALLAGICLRFALPLATRNRRHFDRVRGLDLVPVE